MKISNRLGAGFAATVITVGTALGVAACATTGTTSDAAPAQAQGQGAPGGGQVDTSQLAATLATKLGVDQAKVEAALKEVMSASRPSGQPSGQPSVQPSGQPSGQPDGASGGSGRLQTMATALAGKLGLDESKVLAALQEAMQGQGGGQPSAAATATS